MMKLLVFWFCMLTVYRCILGVNVLGVCNSTLLGFLVEELLDSRSWLRQCIHSLTSASLIWQLGHRCSMLAIR